MKRTLILSLVVVFSLALFTPAFVSAKENKTVVEKVDNTKKAEKKAGCTETKKAECTSTKPAEGCSDAKKAEAKPCCAEKKVEAKSCCSEKKAEVKK